jgi:hypothetical protein
MEAFWRAGRAIPRSILSRTVRRPEHDHHEFNDEVVKNSVQPFQNLLLRYGVYVF